MYVTTCRTAAAVSSGSATRSAAIVGVEASGLTASVGSKSVVIPMSSRYAPTTCWRIEDTCALRLKRPSAGAWPPGSLAGTNAAGVT
jgi:hypothetical protein